jgi:hypothetical protein
VFDYEVQPDLSTGVWLQKEHVQELKPLKLLQAFDYEVRACTHTDHVSVTADTFSCSAITGTDLET